jgi:hypothetical protein
VPTDTSDQQLTLPANADSSDLVTAMTAYNTDVESRLVKRYNSSAERTVRNPAPTEGELCWLLDSNRFEYYTGAAWDIVVPSAFASYRNTNAQSIPTATDTKVQFDTAVETSTAVSAGGTNNDTFTLNLAGRWLITATIRLTGAAAGTERVLSIADGSNINTDRFAHSTVEKAAQTFAISMNVTALWSFPLSQQISAVAFQNSGAGLALLTTTWQAAKISFNYLGA